MMEICIETGQSQPTLFQGIAICRMLRQDFREVRPAEVTAGQSVSEIRAGRADNGMLEQTSPLMWNSRRCADSSSKDTQER